MEKYDSYKNSGVDWIGEIPSHWNTGKLGFYSTIVRGCGYQLLNEVNDDSTSEMEKVIRINDFNYFNPKSFEYSEKLEKYRVIKNDILIGGTGSFGVSMIVTDDIKGFVHSYNVLRVRNNHHNPKYIQFLISSDTVQTQMKLSVLGSIQSFVDIQGLKDLILTYPSIDEQQQIVSFLDTKTSLIDSLIEKTQRKIELLKEKRTSLINEVVTKGLNPNVEMKDSGVEWIGDIPSHWLFTKFNRFVFFQEGPGLRTFQFTDEGTKVICVTNITENGIDFTYKKFISTDEYFEKYQHFTVEKGDFLLSSSGNSWGKVSEYLDDEKVMLNTSTIRLNTLNSSKYNKSLIPHILKSEVVRKQLEILMTGSCQPNFGPSHLNQLVIPIPPLPEQQQIIEYLDEQTQKINKTISIEEKRIELLKEYRQSLISEVVTGKRKVVE